MYVLNLIRKTHWVVYVAATTLIIAVLLLRNHLVRGTGGILLLPDQDAFLQLTTARSMAFYHTWGLDRHFESASPSILYPLILTIPFFIFGAHLIVVPIVNIIAAFVLLNALQKWLSSYAVPTVVQLCILLFVIFLPALPLMILYGMENIFLFLLGFLFTSRLLKEWSNAVFTRAIFVYAALLVATRYDAFLLILVPCLFLMLRRRYTPALELLIWGLLPVLVFGFLSLKMGSYFLPNIYLVQPERLSWQYEWLIGLGLALAYPLLRSWPPARNQRAIGWIGIPLAVVLLTKDVYAFRQSDRSNLQLYRRQYQISKFLHRYYPGYGILSDDMPLTSYFAEARYIDLSGIASVSIARGRLDNYSQPILLKQIIEKENAHIAVLSDRYQPLLPEEWIKTASWEMAAFDTMPKKTYYFYSRDSSQADQIKKNLVEYALLLPPDISVRYYYTRPPKLPSE